MYQLCYESLVSVEEAIASFKYNKLSLDLLKNYHQSLITSLSKSVKHLRTHRWIASFS